jgi:hypothetical protein
MKPTGLLAACGVLAVLGGLVWWTKLHPKKVEPTTPDAPKVLALGEDQIEEIRISKTGTPAVVLKKNGGKWQITEPQLLAADQDSVKALVTSLASLQSDRMIDQKPSDLAVFGLNEPKGEIDVTVKGGTVNKVLLGSDNPSGSASYVKLASNPAVYTLLSSTKTNLDKSVIDLRDKRLVPFDREKVTAISVTPVKGGPFEFGRNGQNEWQITKPRALRADTSQVDDLLRRLGDAKMDLAPDTDDKKSAAEFAVATPVGTVSVQDASGPHAITLRKAKDNAYYARSSSVEGVYKTNADLAEGLKDKDLESFRNKKLFEFGFTDPTKVEINGSVYQKSGDKWTGPSAQMDPPSIQAVIDRLRDLGASKFSEKPAAGTPLLAIAVTYGDKNKTEKVSIVKAGEIYSAQREGDTEGYVLDAKAVEELQKTIAAVKPFQAPKPEKKK